MPVSVEHTYKSEYAEFTGGDDVKTYNLNPWMVRSFRCFLISTLAKQMRCFQLENSIDKTGPFKAHVNVSGLIQSFDYRVKKRLRVLWKDK